MLVHQTNNGTLVWPWSGAEKYFCLVYCQRFEKLKTAKITIAYFNCPNQNKTNMNVHEIADKLCTHFVVFHHKIVTVKFDEIFRSWLDSKFIGIETLGKIFFL